MGWKCAPQIMGLVRGEPKPGQKHRADLRKIALEAGYERASKSDTLDRRRSDKNRYYGYRSGKQFADDMEAEAASYKVLVPGKTKDGQDIIREKGLQYNAVIGWAVIYNPPAYVCVGWTDDEYKKFYEDCRECMAEIEPRIFRRENLRMSAEHFDEGVPPDDIEDISSIDRHMHDLGVCKDPEGHYCGNLIDSKLLININNDFPRMMRERGWDMDDLDTTDYERAKEDKDYALERNAKRRQSGLSVNKHMSKKSKTVQIEASEIIQQVLQLNNDATERMNLAGELMLEAEAQQEYARMKLKEVEEKEAALKRRTLELEEIVRLGRREKARLIGRDFLNIKKDERPEGIEHERRLPNIEYK